MLERLKSKNTILWSLGVLLIAAAIVTYFLFTKSIAVAEVDGKAISKNELYDVLVKQYGSDALDTLITNKVIALEANKKNITISDSEVKKEQDKLIEQYGGEEAFKSAIEQSGVSENDVKEDVKQYVLTQKLLDPRIKITESEMKTYFDENKDSFAQAEQVKASHILVADEKTAKEVKKKLDEGEDFAALAKKYSTDSATANNGGDLGYFGKSEMAAEFEKAAFSLGINKISDPVKTDYGYHIIKVTDKKEAKEATYEDSKDKVKEALKNEKMQSEYPAWLQELKDKYKIENFLAKK